MNRKHSNNKCVRVRPLPTFSPLSILFPLLLLPLLFYTGAKRAGLFASSHSFSRGALCVSGSEEEGRACDVGCARERGLRHACASG